MFYAPYPLGRTGTRRPSTSIPAACAIQPFFARCTATAARARWRDTWSTWCGCREAGQRLKVTRINGVAARLQAVSDELDQLPAEMTKYLVPSAGTYNCRVVAGTDRISAHGHGIAIDIATRTPTTGAGRARCRRPLCARNRIPWEIVEVFERHGFIPAP